MNPKTDYTEVFVIGSTAYRLEHSKHSGTARCAAINMTGTFPPKAPKILFFPGSQIGGGLIRKFLVAVFKRLEIGFYLIKAHLGLKSLFRLAGGLSCSQDSAPARIHPLKTNAEKDQTSTGVDNKRSPLTGNSDANLMLEMKKNRLTRAFEFYRIVDDPK